MWSPSSSSVDESDNSAEFFDALDEPPDIFFDSTKCLSLQTKQSTLEHLKNLSLQEMYLISLQQQLIRKRKDEEEEFHRKNEIDKTVQDESENNNEEQKKAILANEERRKKLSILRKNNGDRSKLERSDVSNLSDFTDEQAMLLESDVSSDVIIGVNQFHKSVVIESSELVDMEQFKATPASCHVQTEVKSCGEEQKFIIVPLKHPGSTCCDDSGTVTNKANPLTFIAFPSSTDDYVVQSSHTQHPKILSDNLHVFEKNDSGTENKSDIVNPLSKQIRIYAGYDQEDSFVSDDASSLASCYSSNVGSTTKSLLWFDRFVSSVESVVHRMHRNYRHEDESALRRSPTGLEHERNLEKIHYSNIKNAEFFQQVKLLQTIADSHAGAIWSMKFSLCGCLLATAGQDNLVKVWALKRYLDYFLRFRNTSLQNNLHSVNECDSDDACHKANCFVPVSTDNLPFLSKPFRVFAGHSCAVLDMSWSRSYFILTSSMDRTVRLWHITRNESLCSFQHINFVTAIVFHPKDDRYFFSASLDGKLRLWNIPDKKVAQWHELSVSDVQGKSLITAINILEEGNKLLVGTYDGRIFLFNECLKYNTMFFVGSTKRKRRKIIGIEPLNGDRDKILITTNDSRIRLYDLRLKEVICKYKGHCNSSSHIKAFTSPDNQYIISGSENSGFYVWKRQSSGIRKHINKIYQRVKVSNTMITVAIFSPAPYKIRQSLCSNYKGKYDKKQTMYHMIATADARGCIKLLWVY